MPVDDDLDAVADACVEAFRAIERGGTPEMRAAVRALLHIVAREIARRDPAARRAIGRDPDDPA